MTLSFDQVKDFVLSSAVQTAAKRMDAGQPFPEELINEAHRRGMLTMRLPTSEGGQGLDTRSYINLMEAVGQGPGVFRLLVHGQNTKWELIHRFGSPSQKSDLLPRFAVGEWFLSFAMTEPHSGTGRDLSTVATRVDDGWEVTGVKHFVTHARPNGILILLAQAEVEGVRQGVTSFVVDCSTPGIQLEPMAATMGLRGAGYYRVALSKVLLPDDSVLGHLGDGMSVANSFLDVTRLSLASSAVGMGQRALDLACDRALDRVTFGKPIGDRQAIQLLLAEMATRVEASRALVGSVASRRDKGEVVDTATSIAKKQTADMINRVTELSMRVHGGMGFVSSSEVERLFRDARSYLFEEGTQEIQAVIIARSLLRERRVSRR